MITFDTYAWIEYLNGSGKGEVARHYTDGDDVVFTPTVCLAELKARMLKEGRQERYIKGALGEITSRSLLVPLDGDIALKAAEFKHEGFYMVDAIVYATALRHDTKLLTGDAHFKGRENIVFME